MTSLLRFALAASLLLALSSVSAQTTFSLHNPTLVVDGNHLAIEGAPLSQYPFTYFYLSIPDVGTYTIAGYPFEGARKAGTFNDTYFEFTAADHQIQIWSTSRLLSSNGLADAYVRFEDRPALDGGAAIISSSPIVVRPATAEARPANSGLSAEELQRNEDALRLAEAIAQRSRGAGTARLEAERAALTATRQRVDEAANEREELVAETTRLTREHRALQSAIAGIRSEVDRLRSGASDLASTRSSLEAERTALRSRSSELNAELDALRSETEALENEVAILRASRERLTETRDDLASNSAANSSERTSLQEMRLARDEAAAERDEYAQNAAGLRREKTELEARIRDLEEQRAQLMQERLRLMADRDQLVRERDALHRETERLRNSAGGNSSASNSSTPTQSVTPTLRPTTDARLQQAERLTARTLSSGAAHSEGARIILDRFDYDRLENPREVLRFIEDVDFPQIAQLATAAGNVMVLFSTDDEGWVVQTEVAEPIGSGLDVVAEQIVRTMHFKLQTVEGHPATLSSHVTVAFNR